MNPVRFSYRMLNRILGSAGLRIAPGALDFDSRLDNPKLLARMHRDLAQGFGEWLSTQTLFTQKQTFDIEKATADFFQVYLASPFRSQGGGSRFNNLLSLVLIARAAQPTLIVDSGTFTGASAWAFALGAPNAKILSFDIDLSRLLRRVPQVEYIQTDWAEYDFSKVPTVDSLCYFDDHIDQVRRLLEAKERGFPLLVFDDDFGLTSFAPMALGGMALPKIEFLFDEDLKSEKELSWLSGGHRHIWPIDHGYLDRGRNAVRAAQRLPNLSLVTGIHQTPYQIVAVSREKLA